MTNGSAIDGIDYSRLTTGSTTIWTDLMYSPYLTQTNQTYLRQEPAETQFFTTEKQQTAKDILAGQQEEVKKLLDSLVPPKASPIAGKYEIPDGYIEIAERIGLVGKTIQKARMLRLFQREEIPVYDPATVNAYMDSICTALTATIKATGKTPARWGGQGAVVWGWTPAPISTFGHTRQTERIYSDPLPLEVIAMIDRVKTAMEKEGIDIKQYAWEISEVEEYPDPFLRLIAKQSHTEAGDEDEQFIVMHWDEPSWSILGNK